MVVVNLYPFYSTVTRPGGTDFQTGIENIDIGGPSMIRGAAKAGKFPLSLPSSIFLAFDTHWECFSGEGSPFLA